MSKKGQSPVPFRWHIEWRSLKTGSVSLWNIDSDFFQISEHYFKLIETITHYKDCFVSVIRINFFSISHANRVQFSEINTKSLCAICLFHHDHWVDPEACTIFTEIVSSKLLHLKVKFCFSGSRGTLGSLKQTETTSKDQSLKCNKRSGKCVTPGFDFVCDKMFKHLWSVDRKHLRMNLKCYSGHCLRCQYTPP